MAEQNRAVLALSVLGLSWTWLDGFMALTLPLPCSSSLDTENDPELCPCYALALFKPFLALSWNAVAQLCRSAQNSARLR